ncbi:SsrA-binding protein SmpB [Candidatus Falkowbacteria bacterium]|nr:SsrA-binding protein SmpB [Candidatus Falkowbacteria bacterium]
MPVLVNNKRASFDYEILEKFEAGLVLHGYEVKSLKKGNGSLKGSFISFSQVKKGALPEAYLRKCFIPKYEKAASISDHEPERDRKLLLKKQQIAYLLGKKNEQGLTLIPTKIYTKNGFVKLEFALAKGKKKQDKRETIKKRELDRQSRALMKNKIRSR